MKTTKSKPKTGDPRSLNQREMPASAIAALKCCAESKRKSSPFSCRKRIISALAFNACKDMSSIVFLRAKLSCRSIRFDNVQLSGELPVLIGELVIGPKGDWRGVLGLQKQCCGALGDASTMRAAIPGIIVDVLF